MIEVTHVVHDGSELPDYMRGAIANGAVREVGPFRGWSIRANDKAAFLRYDDDPEVMADNIGATLVRLGL